MKGRVELAVVGWRSVRFALLTCAISMLGTEASAGEQIADSKIKTLVAELGSPEAGVRERGAGKLSHLLLQTLTHGARMSAEAESIVVEEAVPALFSLLQTRGRAAGARALHNLVGTGAIDRYFTRKKITSLSVSDDVLASAFAHRDSWQAVKVLGYLRPLSPGARRVATRIFREKPMPSEVAVVLAKDGKASRKPLLRAVVSGPPMSRRMAAFGMGQVRLSAEEVKAILEVCRTRVGAKDREIAVRALASSVAPRSRAADALVSFLADPLPETRSEVARTLGKPGPKMAYLLPKLRAMLGTDAEEGACEAIASIGAPESYVDLLTKKIGDSRATPSTRRHCINALARLGQRAKSALPAIRSRIKSAIDDHERLAAVEAVRRIGSK